ncbi:MAG: response regulator [Betaproteobacteria bacterium]|nr:response regulator [Betaproteobacteria bacterium]
MLKAAFSELVTAAGSGSPPDCAWERKVRPVRLRCPACKPRTILARDYADRKLLLVEDDLFNQEITLIILQEIWPVVDLAEDGLQAVERVKGKRYDLILMDMQMPRMDGLDATRQIRTLPNGSGVPVVAMTGNAFVEDRNRCYDAGMNDFLTKPVKPGDLFEVILKWIRR